MIKHIKKYAPTTPIVSIGNMIDIKKFKPKSFQKNKTPKNFISIGGLNNCKGLDLLIPAFNELKKEIPDISLKIIGSGNDHSLLKKLISKYDLQKNIKLLGQKSPTEIQFYLEKSDFFILTSRYEAFGIVFIEAMAMGKPIITSDQVTPNVITKETGIRLSIDSTNSIVNGIKEAINNFPSYDPKTIRDFAIKNYSTESIMQKLTTIYSEVINQRYLVSLNAEKNIQKLINTI